MKKKWVKKLMLILGALFGVFLLANLGLNIWLKTQLPNYIKNNTDYKVSYKRLDVNLITGNIFASQITVNNKNPQNINVIGLQGTVDTLKISRFGIYDAVFNKIISSSDLLLAKPNLNITLAKPVDQKTGKKRNPVSFENIRINNGTINIFKHTSHKFLSVNHLDLYVENLQMTEEEAVENKLPVIFDQYSIKGKDFFFQPDDVYTLKINTITTRNGQVSVENFQLKPLVSFDQFKKLHPKKPQLYQFHIQKVDFKDVVLKKNKISLANATFHNPNLLIYTTNAIPDKLKKPFNFELNLDDVKMNNATVQVNKPDGSKLLYAKQVYLTINYFEFSKEISKETIPVRYKNFNLSGQNIQFYDHQNITVKSMALNPKRGDLRNISMVPDHSAPGKTAMNLKADKVAFNMNKWEIIDKKLNLDVKDVLINGVSGSIKAGVSKPEKKSDFNGIQFPVIIRKVMIRNSNITYDKGNQPLSFDDLNATITGIELRAKPNSGMAFTMKDYTLNAKNFIYKTKFYNMSVGQLDLNKNKIKIDRFAMKPLVSRSQFIRMIPVESDLYDLKINQITAVGNWDLLSKNKFIHAKNITILSADANIFRSKTPEDDPKEKLLYSKLLRSMKIPLFVDNLDLKNSFLEYEEDTPTSSGPGKLTFSSMNMNVKNLNSAKMKGKPTQVNIKIDCTFMKTSSLSVKWSFDTADQGDHFYIAGRAAGIPAVAINAFIVPYLSVSATGTIQEMLFDFKGNSKGIGGTFNLKHQDLKVSILDKESKEKKGLLSAVANVFIKSDSGKFPESVIVEEVERDPTKAFFNLFWKGIEDGLKKTLIGQGIAKTQKTVKNTINAVKDVKEAVQETKEGIIPKDKKKKGFLKRVFNKKESSETK